AKLITPFGFVGRFAAREFKQRLQDEYHAGETPSAQPDNHATDAIRMNRFLLDYVLDMGPADITLRPSPQLDSSSSSPADVELGNLQAMPDCDRSLDRI
ncbi:hypothetical protein FRC07_005557, partial [Ceratobasidium sp. 392]